MSTQPAAKAPASKIWEENATPRHRIQWCPGCGDYGVLNALKMALTRLELMPHEVLLIGGIGCSGQIRNYLNGNGFHGTHGGPLAYAVGVKMANPDLRVMALAGDGDTFAIGVENFVHTCRRDPEVTLIVMDNGVYGLTTGQRSPSRSGLNGGGSSSDPSGWSCPRAPPSSRSPSPATPSTRPKSTWRRWSIRASRSSTTSRPDRKSTRLNSSHGYISYAVFCLKKTFSLTDRTTRPAARRARPTTWQ